jgi:hypothetical protein
MEEGDGEIWEDPDEEESKESEIYRNLRKNSGNRNLLMG